MAVNGDTRRSPEHWHGKPPMHSSFDSWVTKSGKDAYGDFKTRHPKTGLSYEAWCQTDQVSGEYLFYVASLLSDSDSDEETPKRRRISRVQGDKSKKTGKPNSNGGPRTATPTPATIPDEISASGKRKRKPRRKYMSQELVASDDEPTEQVGIATPTAEAETLAAAELAVNGRRKSASRKPRKKPISDETISPEDEDEDVMDVDASVMVSALPVRSAPRTPAATKQSESPKKATPKEASVKKSTRSFLVRLPFHLWDAVNLEEKSEEMLLDEKTNCGNASIANVSRPATTPAATSKTGISNNIKPDADADDDGDTLADEGTPDPSGANTRRGLRNRKPAQQRPYYHDAQVFEDVETEQDESELESLAREQSLESPQPSKPRHFKGKGRAWKKDGSDEDEEFVTPKEKRAAKVARAKAEREKAKAENQTGDEEDITGALMDYLNQDLEDRTNPTYGAPKGLPKQKKTRKPRKSNPLSEELVRDDSENDTPQQTPSQPPKRGRGRPRKSALSSELVRDDSDEDKASPVASAAANADSKPADKTRSVGLATPPKGKSTSRPSTAPASTPKKRGRPRKSESVAASTPAKAKVGEEQHCAAPVLNRGAALVQSLYPRDASASTGIADAEGGGGEVVAAEVKAEAKAAEGEAAATETAATTAQGAAPPTEPLENPRSASPPQSGGAQLQQTKSEAESGPATELPQAEAASTPPATVRDGDRDEDRDEDGNKHRQGQGEAERATPTPQAANKHQSSQSAESNVLKNEDEDEDDSEDVQSVAMSLGSRSSSDSASASASGRRVQGEQEGEQML